MVLAVSLSTYLKKLKYYAAVASCDQLRFFRA